MRKSILLFIFLILITGCMNQENIYGTKNVSEMVNSEINNLEKEKNENDAALIDNQITEQITEQNMTETITETVNETKEITNATTTQIIKQNDIKQNEPQINEKCRASAIIYGGCHWKDTTKDKFELTIKSAARDLIKGVWFVVHGTNYTKYIERTEDLVPESVRTYSLSYAELKKECGEIVKFEVLPIETINGTDYACYNQRTSFVPVNNCKLPPIRVD